MESKQKWLRFAAYLLAAWLVTLVFILRYGFDDYARVRFADWVHGQAYRPFAYRALVPSILGVVDQTPINIKAFLALPLDQFFFLPKGPPSGAYFAFIVFMAIVVGCFLGFQYALRALIRHFYPEGELGVSPLAVELGPIAAIALIPLSFRYFNYLYDPATLLLFTTSILWLVQEKRAYWLGFLLCCLNKETAILLIPLYLAYHLRRTSLPTLALHLCLQALIYAGAWAFVHWRFAQNPGVNVEMHWLDHNLPMLTFQRPFFLLGTLAMVVPIVYLCRKGWRQKPAFPRLALLIVFIPQLVLGLAVGVIDELRIFYESYPFIFLIALPSVLEWGSVSGSAPMTETVPTPAVLVAEEKENGTG